MERAPSRDEIYFLWYYISHCMGLAMDKTQTANTLATQFDIPQTLTQAVWEILEEANPEVFNYFNENIELHRQMVTNNLHLLRQHNGDDGPSNQQPPVLPQNGHRFDQLPPTHLSNVWASIVAHFTGYFGHYYANGELDQPNGRQQPSMDQQSGHHQQPLMNQQNDHHQPLQNGRLQSLQNGHIQPLQIGHHQPLQNGHIQPNGALPNGNIDH